MIACRILLASLFFLSAEAWLLTPLVFSGEPQEGSVAVRLYLTDGALPKDDPMSSAWDSVQPSEFKLSPQVHWQDRIQEVTVKSVKVRGVHNGEDLAILLEYQDPTEDAADASGLEFMVGEKMAHFAHGQEMLQVEGGPVNIWYWKNENGKAIDMSAKGFKTLRVQDQQDVSATGAWQDGTWRVVFSRPLQTGDEQDAQIQPGKWVSVAFAVWDGVVGEDGGVKEKGSQKAVSSWWSIRAEPPPDNTVYGWVVFLIVIAAAFEMVLVRNLKKGQAA
ncbi:MAG: hypothetical protein IH977_16700 [Nitrospinae bacterium]|nr:hypothetical protein [Nitrospinota bacterium]